MYVIFKATEPDFAVVGEALDNLVTSVSTQMHAGRGFIGEGRTCWIKNIKHKQTNQKTNIHSIPLFFLMLEILVITVNCKRQILHRGGGIFKKCSCISCFLFFSSILLPANAKKAPFVCSKAFGVCGSVANLSIRLTCPGKGGGAT